MKRWIISLVLCLCVCLLVGELISRAEAANVIASGSCGDSVKWTLDSDGVLTIRGSGKMHNYSDYSYSSYNRVPWYSQRESIHSVVIEQAVTSIGDYAFSGCSRLTSITIPNGVTSIGDYAFYRCSSLTSITIPEGVTSIGYRAFSGCSRLTSITLPDSVTSIRDEVFSGCSSLTSITIPEGVTSIGDYAFSGCSRLTSITIPEGVASIGDNAFYVCSGLKSVTIGEGVTSIGYWAFGYCTSLTSITLPDSVTSIRDKVFYCCSSLTSITIPEGVTSIGTDAFSDCSSLTSITLPDSVTSIWNRAFYHCSSLTSITLPDSVTSIRDEVFYGCGSLASIAIPNSVTSIGNKAFYCTSLTSITIPKSVTSIGDKAFYGCRSLTSITIPEGVTSIRDEVFSDCRSLTSITIPKSVTSIGDNAFDFCNSLKVVAFLGEKPSINSRAFAGVAADAYYPESLDSDSSWEKSGALSGYGGMLNWKPWYTLGDNLFCEHVLEDTVVPPTCTWGYTLHKCACGYSYRTDFEPGSGHDWGEPVYEWADDHSAITATRVCKRDPDHTETENGVVTSAVTKEATYDAEGEITYTATFTNAAFATQSAVVKTPRLEHPTPTPAENPFADIHESAYYHDPVLWAVANNVTNGTSDSTFSPDEGCTRAQVVTFLWRVAGKPEPASSKNPFTDVAETAYYYKAVLWAVEQGITNGMTADTFSPDETCTRAQIVTFLWRYEEQPAPAGSSNPFADVKPSAYFGSAVLWAVERGITNGTSATTFDPEDTCTRAQVVTFLYRDIVKS